MEQRPTDLERVPRSQTLLAALWRNRVPVAVAAVAAGALALVLTMLATDGFESEVAIALREPPIDEVRGSMGLPGDADEIPGSETSVIESSPVLLRASEMIHGEPSARAADEIGDMIETEVGGGDVLVVRARSDRAEVAAEVAESVAAAYEEVRGTQIREAAEESQAQLEVRRAGIEEELEVATPEQEQAMGRERLELRELAWRSERLDEEVARYGSGVIQRDGATDPVELAAEDAARNVVVAGLLALMLAGGFLWWRQSDDPRVWEPRDARDLLGIPFLGEISEEGDEASQRDEARFALASLTSVCARQGAEVVAVTGPTEGQGTTYVASVLASVEPPDEGDAGPRLIDAAERDEIGGEDGSHLPAVLVDTPPVASSAVGTRTAEQVDGVVLVIRRGAALRDLEATIDRLGFVDAPLLGYVFNGWAPERWFVRRAR